MNTVLTNGVNTIAKVYIANLGEYNNGRLVGGWLKVPFTEEEFNNLMVEIKLGSFDKDGNYTHGLEVRGEYFEEFAIHDWETINNIDLGITEYSNLTELNKLCKQLEDKTETELKEFQAYINTTGDTLEDAINNIEDNANFYHLDSDCLIDNLETELAYQIVDNIGSVKDTVGDRITSYFDFEKFGRDLLFGGDIDILLEEEEEFIISIKEKNHNDIANWFLDYTGQEVEDLDTTTLENYFDYSKFGQDLCFENFTIDNDTKIAVEQL